MLTSGRLKISSLPSVSFLYQSLSFPTMYQTCDLVYDHHFKKQIPRQTILLQCRCESMALQILDIYRPCLAPYPRNLIPKDSETPAFQRQKPKMHRGNCLQKIFIKVHSVFVELGGRGRLTHSSPPKQRQLNISEVSKLHVKQSFQLAIQTTSWLLLQ